MNKEPKTNPWLALMALVPGTAMTFMDQTILPVALPAIQKDFEASTVLLQWSVNAYLLTLAILVLVGGKLCDQIGQRRALLIGLALFALSSALCGVSPNIYWLVFARILQGIGAALLIPCQNAFVAKLFPPQQRGKALGIMVSLGAMFSITAPMLGGYFVQTFSWHWIFWINLPIACAGWILTCAYLPSVSPRPTKVDTQGFLYFALCSGLLTFAFMEAQNRGFSFLCVISLLALAPLALLVRREKKAAHPFLDITLFRHPRFASANLSIMATQFILTITVFRAIYFQNVLDYTPFATGVLSCLSGIPLLFMAPLGGFLSDRFGSKIPITLGFLLLIGSFVAFGLFSTPPPLFLLAITSVFGTGLALIFTPSYSAGMSSVPPHKVGTGAGIIATFRSLAATAGVAILGASLGAIQDTRFLKTPDLPPMGHEQLISIANGTLNIAKTKGSSTEQSFLAAALREARIDAFSQVHLGLAFFLLIALIAFLLLTHRTPKYSPHYPPSEGWD